MRKNQIHIREVFSKDIDPEQLSNRELIERCLQLGNITLESRRMFIGLLPLVARRKAYDIRKFSSIHHFASIVGGAGYHLVDEVLRLDKQLEEFPRLRKMLYSGEIGWAKIRLVISMVHQDDQERWLNLLRDLSKPALEIYLRDFRKQTNEENNLFSEIDMPNIMIGIAETSCISEENAKKSYLPQKSAIFEAESFPGKTCESENKNNIEQIESEKIRSEEQGMGIGEPSESSPKKQELFSKREKFSCIINQWLGAQLRLFRKKLEKEQKKWINWEDVLAELLKNTIS